jgi:hypothetical protein
MHQKRDEEYNQKYKKENLGDARCGEGDASKTKKSRHERHQQENQCVIQHHSLLAPPNSSACAYSFSVRLNPEVECARKH